MNKTLNNKSENEMYILYYLLRAVRFETDHKFYAEIESYDLRRIKITVNVYNKKKMNQNFNLYF